MKPSIGRIVIYHMDDAEHATYAEAFLDGVAAREHPAVITRVVGDQILNLMVMLDGATPEPRIAVPGAKPEEPSQRGWSWPTLILPIDDKGRA